MPDFVRPYVSGQLASPVAMFCRAAVPACMLLLTFGAATAGHAQKYFPTATKKADLEVGGGYVLASPDYSNVRFQGITGYAVFDFTPHFGVEFDIHQVNTTGDDHIYERTYELGGRYVRHYGRYNPYLRASVGRGVFNYPFDQGNLAYNIFAGAAGIDVRIKHHVFARVEYEAQDWLKFQRVSDTGSIGNSNLQPDVLTIGAAYHF